MAPSQARNRKDQGVRRCDSRRIRHEMEWASTLGVKSGMLAGAGWVWGGVGPGRRKGCKSAGLEQWLALAGALRISVGRILVWTWMSCYALELCESPWKKTGQTYLPKWWPCPPMPHRCPRPYPLLQASSPCHPSHTSLHGEELHGTHWLCPLHAKLKISPRPHAHQHQMGWWCRDPQCLHCLWEGCSSLEGEATKALSFAFSADSPEVRWEWTMRKLT